MPKTEVYFVRARLARDELGMKYARKILLEMRTESRALAHGPYATGALVRSIRISGPRPIGDDIEGSVGTRKKYAWAVEGGAKVHEIYPKGVPHIYRFGSRKRPQLQFFWRKVGSVVLFPHIPGGPGTVRHSHPGQKGKHYLRRGAEIVAARHGLKFTGGGPV